MSSNAFNFTTLNTSQVRRRNRRILLHELRLNGALSRAELARASGLTPPAIASIVQDLIEAGLVREAGRRKSLRGQPPIEIEIAKDGGYAIGLRIAANGYDFVVSDLGGDMIAGGNGDFPDGETGDLLDFITGLYVGLAEQHGAGRSLGLGLVTPGPFDIEWPGTATPGAIPALQTRSLVDALSERLSTDVFLENDATAAALGERLNGVALPAGNFFYIFVGEGVGGGIVIRGEPYRGTTGNAGEFGHIIVDPNGPQCYCGNRGCLGQYLSLSSLRQRRNSNPAKSTISVDSEWLNDAAGALSNALVSIENLLDPEMIVLGGTAPTKLLLQLIDKVGELRPSVRVGRPNRLVISDLGEKSAAIGASALPIIAATSPQ